MNTTRRNGAAYIDLLAPDMHPLSDDVLAAREENWYAWTNFGPGVLRYEEASALLKDRRLRRMGEEQLEAQGVTDGLLASWWKALLATMDGDDHTRIRRLVTKAFSRRLVDRLRPAMREAANELIDGFVGEGECEFMDAFASRFPIRIFCRLVGIPSREEDEVRMASDELRHAFGYGVAEHRGRIEAALAKLLQRADMLIEERRTQRGDDLVSMLLDAEEEGDRLTHEEVRITITSLLFGGDDTTRNQFGLAMSVLIDHPEQRLRLAKDPSLAPRAVEEIMRVAPSNVFNSRVALESFEFNGLHVKEGDHVVVFVATAQTDPRVYGPPRFDITREPPAPLLSFGGGPHHCLGAWLARCELMEALPVVARRLRRPTKVGSIDFLPFLGIHGPQQLPIRFIADAVN